MRTSCLYLHYPELRQLALVRPGSVPLEYRPNQAQWAIDHIWINLPYRHRLVSHLVTKPPITTQPAEDVSNLS